MTPSKTTSNAPHIVVIGCAYAGLSALNELISLGRGRPSSKAIERVGLAGNGPSGNQGAEVPQGGRTKTTDLADHDDPRALRIKPRYTIIDERDGFYHTVGAPLGQISLSFAREFWVRFDEIFTARTEEAIEFLQGSVVNLDVESKSLTFSPARAPIEAEKLSYDFLVVASGMRRKWPVVPTSYDYGTYLKDVRDWGMELAQCNRIVLVGGGACGIEMAAEVKVHFPSKDVILVHSRNQLLSNEPLRDDFKAKALELLREQGVDVRLNTRVESDAADPTCRSRLLTLSTSEPLICDKVIYTATQQGANTDFVPEPLKEEKNGCVQVRDTFQFASSLPNADVHYAMGDAAHWPSTIKRCGPAQNQGKIAAANIVISLFALEQGQPISDVKMQSSQPGKASMTLAIGEQAVSMRNGRSFGKGVKMGAFGTGLGIDGTLASLGLRPRRTQDIGQVTQVLNSLTYRGLSM